MKRIVISIVALIALAFPSLSHACGVIRWPVKVAQDKHVYFFYKDRDVATGELVAPVATTIAKLSKKPWPFEWTVGQMPQKWSYTQRNGQAEFTLWQLTATLVKKKNEDDLDYHLVIKSGTKQMIAEIPSEACVAETPEPIKSMVIQARLDFDDWYDQQTNKQNLNAKVRLTGIGFFDRVHGNAEGQVQKNGIELHPVVKIEFLD